MAGVNYVYTDTVFGCLLVFCLFVVGFFSLDVSAFLFGHLLF